MSYGVTAIGTKEDVHSTLDKWLGSNTSPEMPLILPFLHAIVDAVEGDDKRIVLEANGWHSGGQVQHTINVKTAVT